jgi:hypothetical protein
MMAIRLDQRTDAATDINWLVDRINLVRLRLRAARYGLRIRSRWSLLEFITIIGLPLTIVGLILAIPGVEQWHPLRNYARLVVRHPGLSISIAICLGGSISWVLVRYLGQFSSIMRVAAATERGARMLREDMDAGMRNPQLYEHLIDIYQPMIGKANAALQEQGYSYQFKLIAPATAQGTQSRYAAIALHCNSSTRLDNLLGHVADKRSVEFEEFAANFAENRQRLMRKWRELDGKPDFDDEGGPNYTLEEIRVIPASPEPQLQFNVGVASYGQIMRTCHALVNEFALLSYMLGQRTSRVRRAKLFRRHRLPTAPTTSHPPTQPGLTGGNVLRIRPSTTLACLPWRAKIHSMAESDSSIFLRPLDRAAGIGITVCTLFPIPSGGYHVALGIRSDLVGTYPRALHVIPAGMCNTHETGHLAWQLGTAPRSVTPTYLTTVMKSEFLEEWFNDEELESGRSVGWEERVAQKWSGAVKELHPIVLTGIAYDLLSLRPEVCGLVAVDHFDGSLNSEYMPRLSDTKVILETIIEPTEIVQSGAAALMLAQDYCGSRLNLSDPQL